MSVTRDGWSQVVLPLAVTQLLDRRPSHGYELVQRLDAAGFPGVNGGTLYPLLHRLEADDAVSWSREHPSAGPARKSYALTPAGSKLTDDLAGEWIRLSRHIARFLDQGRGDRS
jgi:PadR family transcriptional regulator PadR